MVPFIPASGIRGGCLVEAGAVLQVGDLINQNIPPSSRQCFRLICFCPSGSPWVLGLVLVCVVLAPALLEEEGGGSQAGFGSGLLSEC